MTNSSVCTLKFHDALKVSACWEMLTYPIGTVSDGDGGLLTMRNCKLCHSTLGKVVYGSKAAAVANDHP